MTDAAASTAVAAPPAARAPDALRVVGGAALATAAICAMPQRPLATLAVVAALLALFLARWHARRDLAGLAVGATLGNLTELACDAAGVWVHATRDVLGVAPAYIFLCYPILGVALPRLIDALLGVARPAREARERGVAVHAALLWGAHAALSYRFGTDNAAEALVSATLLALTLARFHSPHDLATGGFCALLAMVWELPCTALGAWRFPHPQLFGLIPAWLPLAYAVFFINLGRVTAAWTARGAAARLAPAAARAAHEPTHA